MRVLRRGLAAPMDVEVRITGLQAEARQLLTQKGITTELTEQHCRAWTRSISCATKRMPSPGTPNRSPARLPLSCHWLPHAIARGRRHRISGVHSGPRRPVRRTHRRFRSAQPHHCGRAHSHHAVRLCARYLRVLDHAMQPVSDARTLALLARAMRQQLLAPQPGRDFSSRSCRARSSIFRSRRAFTSALRTTAHRPSWKSSRRIVLGCCTRWPLPCSIASAACDGEIATYGERAEDVFFVTGRDGHVLPEAPQGCLQTEIERRLGPASAQPWNRSRYCRRAPPR